MSVGIREQLMATLEGGNQLDNTEKMEAKVKAARRQSFLSQMESMGQVDWIAHAPCHCQAEWISMSMMLNFLRSMRIEVSA